MIRHIAGCRDTITFDTLMLTVEYHSPLIQIEPNCCEVDKNVSSVCQCSPAVVPCSIQSQYHYTMVVSSVHTGLSSALQVQHCHTGRVDRTDGHNLDATTQCRVGRTLLTGTS